MITSGQRSRIVNYVLNRVGAPYLYGGRGAAFDCSELTMKALAKAGIKVPHNSGEQAQLLLAVPNTKANRARLKPGDVMFWYGSLKDPASVTHCGIYVGKRLPGQYMVVAAVDERHGVMKHRSNWALPPIGFALLDNYR